MQKFKLFLKEKWNVVLYFICFGLIVLMIIGVKLNTEKNSFSVGANIDISDGWNYWYEDGQKGTTSLPAALPESKERSVYLSRTLPEVQDNYYFVFRARHTFVKVTIDGKVIVDSVTAEKEKNRWYTLLGNHFVEIEMKKEYSGKEIVIECYSSESRYTRRPGEVFLGDRGLYIAEKTEQHIATYVCSIMIAVMGIVLFAIWLASMFVIKVNAREILCLMFFTLSAAMWIYTETDMVMLLGRDSRELTLVALEMLMLLPVPIALFFYYLGVRKVGQTWSRIVATVPVIWFIIANILHFCHIVSLTRTLIITQIMLGVELIIIAVIQVTEIKYIHQNSEKYGKQMGKVPLVGIAVLVPFTFFEISKYVFLKANLKQDGVFLSVGIMVYIISLAIDWVVRMAYNKARIEHGTELKTQFLANMSHEIRTPLNSILGFNEAIIQNPEDVKAVVDYSKNIREAGYNLKEIINSILDISKIEMGQLQIESREYGTFELFDNLSSMFGMLAQKKNLEFVTEIDPAIPKRLIGDEQHLRQVLTNILGNAVKYTDKGSVRFKVDLVDMSPDSPLCRLKFSVKDTGRGIKPEDREKLFEKFQRLDTKHFEHTEGSGLGMSIVLFTLKAMGSQIQFDSEFEKGSDFYFEIDQVAIDREGIGDFGAAKELNSNNEVSNIEFRAPKAEILIVDDVPMNIEAAKAMLKYTQMQIDGALSGAEAIEKIKNKHYDIVFMDHMMPEMDGIQTTEAIRNLAVEFTDSYYAALPVIALTANVMVGVREMYQQAGMQDFVSKPIQIANVIEVLNRWLPSELIEKASEMDISNHVAFAEVASNEEWTIDISGIDAEYAKQFNVSFDGLVQNIRSYETAYESNRKQIEEYYWGNDLKNYIIKVHGLKSTSKMIGAKELYKLAESVEHLGNEENRMTEDDFRSLMALYEKQVSYIRVYLNQNASADVAVISEEQFMEVIGRIKKAGQDYDAAAFMWLDDELRDMQVPQEYQEAFKEIKLKVSLLQYSEAVDYIESQGL